MNALRRTGTIQPILARATARALPRMAVLRPEGAAFLHATRPPAEGTFHHVKDPENSADAPFEFDEESEKEIAFTLSKYPDTLQGKQSAIMPMLWIVQQQLDKAHATINAANPRGAMPFPKTQGGGGWVPLAAMHKVCPRPPRPPRSTPSLSSPPSGLVTLAVCCHPSSPPPLAPASDCGAARLLSHGRV